MVLIIHGLVQQLNGRNGKICPKALKSELFMISKSFIDPLGSFTGLSIKLRHVLVTVAL